MLKQFLFILLIALATLTYFQVYGTKTPVSNIPEILSNTVSSPTPTPTPTLPPIPTTKILENNYHVFQTFNNCGPAALSMALSYYGINKSQLELGQALRPYQNPQGNNDDKSVTLDELAQKASEYNLIPFHRPNGSVELVKQFIAQGIPVITRTRLKETDDIGHYRVIKGYDDTTDEFIQDDSLQGHNLRYSYTSFMSLWQMFDYEYLVLVPTDKEQIAQRILGENADVQTAWKNAVESSQRDLISNPDDIYARFNLSVALYHTGDYQGSVSEFEMVESRLPFRTLWYQIEPIQAYYELGNYQRVFNITNIIFNNQNRSFSELYIIRGEIYQKQGNIEAARSEFEKAVLYKKNLQIAQQLLQSVQ
jgi:tetratricopeptide (TPR) repeat protein